MAFHIIFSDPNFHELSEISHQNSINMALLFISCTSIKVIGDPVDGIRYKQSQYDFNLKRLISLELKSDESIDTVDDDGKSPTTIKKQELGFDLMSLTSARGHFVDKVSTT